MAGLNLAAMSRTYPNQQHGVLAAARLGSPYTPIAQQDLAKLASKAGFKKIGADQYKHADGSWATVQNGAVVTGYNKNVFTSLPIDVTQYQVLPMGGAAGQAAAAVKPSLQGTSPTKLAALLVKDGFTQPDPKIPYFSHADGSWVAVIGKEVVRGNAQQRIDPKDLDAPIPVGKRKGPGGKSFPLYRSLPAGDWNAWQKKFAVAKLPFFNLQTFQAGDVVKVLKHLGFKEGSAGQWLHPDGSQVVLANGNQFQSSKFQRWGFGSYPYKNGTDYSTMSTQTQAWKAWTDGSGKPPWPKY